MQATINSCAAVVPSRFDDRILHDMSKAPMMAAPERKSRDDELLRLHERALVVFHELEPKLRGMIEKRISPRLKGRVDVEGIFQNSAECEILKSLESKQPESDAELRAWIFKRTWSRWQDDLRRWSYAIDTSHVRSLFPAGQTWRWSGESVSRTNFGLKETVERIRDALKPVDFQIVELRIVDELSYDELAEFLNLTPESVRKRFTRALLKIKHVVSSPFSSSS